MSASTSPGAAANFHVYSIFQGHVSHSAKVQTKLGLVHSGPKGKGISGEYTDSVTLHNCLNLIATDLGRAIYLPVRPALPLEAAVLKRCPSRSDHCRTVAPLLASNAISSQRKMLQDCAASVQIERPCAKSIATLYAHPRAWTIL